MVREPDSEADIWWGAGSPNYEMDERTFILNRERAVDYLNTLDRLYGERWGAAGRGRLGWWVRQAAPGWLVRQAQRAAGQARTVRWA